MFQHRFAGFCRVALLIIVVQLSVFTEVLCDVDNTTIPEERYYEPKPKGIAAIKRHIADYPYLVALVYGKMNWTDPLTFLCSGAIISESYVVSTASCVSNISPYMTSIIAQSTVIVQNDKSTWGILIDVHDIITHSEFDPKRLINDIALVKTIEPIIFTGSIQPVKLQKKNKPFDDQALVMISGWGGTKDKVSEVMSYHVMVADVPVINHYQCWETFNKAYTTFTKSMWCCDFYHMGDDDNDKFEGDHGSPAVQRGALVGLVTYIHHRRVETVYPLLMNIGSPEIRDFIQEYAGV